MLRSLRDSDSLLSEVSSCSSQLLCEPKLSCCVLLSCVPAGTSPPAMRWSIMKTLSDVGIILLDSRTVCQHKSPFLIHFPGILSQQCCAQQAGTYILEISHFMASELDPDFSHLSLSFPVYPSLLMTTTSLEFLRLKSLASSWTPKFSPILCPLHQQILFAY